MKTKNIHKKSKKNFFSKIKKLVLRIVQKKLQMKFERNLCSRFRDNCDTDDGRTDGRTTDKSPIPWALLTESSRANDTVHEWHAKLLVELSSFRKSDTIIIYHDFEKWIFLHQSSYWISTGIVLDTVIFMHQHHQEFRVLVTVQWSST